MNCPRCTTPLPEHSRYCLACGASVSGNAEETADFDPSLVSRLQDEMGGEFVIERELGRGGMALVFQAHDTRLGRRVAIKVLPPELTFGRPDTVERFKREARTAATLDHPHIIPIYRVSGEGRLTWYVMKFLNGESLDKLLQRVWRLSVDAAVNIVNQMASALQHAHDQGVVHRDVKPANAMIDPKGWITVMDFGIAKAMDAEALTGTGSTIGTPFYMSPEQCNGNPVSGASDQYSLGVVAWQMLGGRVPFTGANVVDIIRRHCFDAVPPLRELRPELTMPVVQVIERALAKKPEDRFPSVTSFAKALELASQGVDVGISYPASGAHLAADETVIMDQVRDRRKKPRPAPGSRKRRLRAALLAGAVLVALGGASVSLLQPWSGMSATPPDSGKQVEIRPIAAPPDTVRREPARPAAPVTAPPPAPPAVRPQAAPATGSATLTLGTTPNSVIFINGAAQNHNPVTGVTVPAGRVRFRFQVTEADGTIWTHDTTFVFQAGQNYQLGRIPLRRP